MNDYKELARQTRKEVLSLIYKAQTSHIASNFSVIDMATVLYENLKLEDRVVWSKGWAAATIYYFLYKQGKISYEQLQTFPAHPYLGLAEPGVNGVEVSGGAMGHGLPVAVGMALGKRRAKESGTVYCIMSDGELNEGTTWEAAALAAQLKLDNLVVLIDVNKWQAMGKTKDVVNFEPIGDKFTSFRFIVDRGNGHDYTFLDSVLDIQVLGTEMPRVIICDTIKGKGVSFMENHLLYHYKQISDEEYRKAMEELV